MKALGLDWLRPLSSSRLVRWTSYAVIGFSGVLVCAIGLTDYVRNGFKWPAELDR